MNEVQAVSLATSQEVATESRSEAATARAALQLADECRLLAFNAALEVISAPEEDQDVVHLLAEMERVAAQVRRAVEAFAEAEAALGSMECAAEEAGPSGADPGCAATQDVLQ